MSMFGVRSWLAGVLGLSVVLQTAASAQVPPSEALLPTTTQGWVSVPDFQKTRTQWNQTAIGKLMDDPVMKPFRDDIEAQIRERRDKDGTNIGFTWDDLRQIAGGEVSLALVHAPGRQPARVALIDVTGHVEQTKAVMQRLRANLLKQKGTKRSEKQIGGATVNTYTQDGETRVSDFLHGNLFCATGDEAVTIDILNRLLKRGGDNLASLKPYVQVKARLMADNQRMMTNPKTPPHVRWFINPIGYSDAQRALNPREDDEGVDLLAVAKKVGFKGLLGTGGFARFNGTEYDLLHRIAVYAPQPWTKSMNMLSLVNDGGMTAVKNRWIPSELASHSAGHVELLKAFDHYGPFFDEVVGGRKDAWQRVLDRIASKVGPGVDVREEMVKPLVTTKDGREVARCIVLTDVRRPVDARSQRQLIAVKIHASATHYVSLGNGPNGKPCAPDNATPEQHQRAAELADDAYRSVLMRYFKPEMQAVAGLPPLSHLRKNVVPGIDMIERLPEEDEDEEDEKTPVALKVEVGKKVVKVPPPKVAPIESEAFCVTHGHYLYATHKSLMVKVLKHIHDGGLPLADDIDYTTVMSRIDDELKRRGWPHASIRQFSRTDEGALVNYELARTGRLEESDSVVARLINDVLDPSSTDDGKPLDYSKLPNYATVRPFLKPSGLLVRTETGGEDTGVKDWSGWFIVSFTLKR